MNPNIALSYKNPEFTTPYQLEAGASELRKNDLINAIAQQKMQQENALSSLWKQSGGDVEKVKQGLYQAGFGDKAMEIEQHQREVEKEKRLTVKQEYELRAAKLSHINETLATSTPETWPRRRQELVALNDGVDDGSLPEQFDPALVQDALQKVIGAKGMIDQKAKEQGIELEWAKFGNLQQHQNAMLEETRRGHDIQAGNQPLMQVVDPVTGLPKYVKRNEAEGQQAYSPTGITNKPLPPQQVQANDALEMEALIKQARPLIEKSTGSGIGAQADAAAGYFGQTLPGAENAAQLKVIGGAIVAKMPKPPGPASDRDILLAKEQGAQLGDPSIPYEQKLKALEALQQINARQVERATQAGLLKPKETTLPAYNEEDQQHPRFEEYLKAKGIK